MSKVEDLTEKLAARALVGLAKIWIAPHESVTKDGHPYHVKGYYRTVGGGGGPNLPSSNAAAPSPGGSSSNAPNIPNPKLPGGTGSADVKTVGVAQATGEKDSPIVTSDVNEAARLLGEGKYVRLNSSREVSTLLDRLASIVEDAKARGAQAPMYDLCKVSVTGTNLFCAESKGIARVQMPQLSGVPEPGSPADKLPKNAKGEVDLSEKFAEFLGEQHATVENTTIDAKYLKASQNELNGVKVTGISKAIDAGKFDPTQGSIWVSNDDYIVDGHHRWAATVASEIRSGGPINIQIRRVNLDIITVLNFAKLYAVQQGIASKDASSTGPPAATKLAVKVREARKLLKLATVVVPRHPSVSKTGNIEDVDAYTYYRRSKIARDIGSVPSASAIPTKAAPSPLSEAAANARGAQIESLVRFALDRHLATHETHGTVTGYDDYGNPIIAWDPERALAHNKIVDDLYERHFARVPTEGKAIVAGGLPGAGKTTVLKSNVLGVDLKRYGTVNPDEIKEELIKRHLAPEIEGLSPLETSPLIHEESSHVAKLLADRAYADRKNIIWDITMSSLASTSTRIADLRAHGYTEVRGLLVEISIQEALVRARQRWLRGVEAWRRGVNSLGGRYVPPAFITRMARGPRSVNANSFDLVRGDFDSWVVVDMMGEKPVVVRRS